MDTKKVEHLVKSSIVYGYAVTQPFLLYSHASSSALDVPQQSPIWKDTSKIVRHIQEHSSDTNKITVAYPLLKEKTEKAVKSSHQIKVEGQENKQDMEDSLVKEKKQHFEEIQSDISTIEYGESSEHVEKVQEALAFYDYYEGEIDGIYGAMTETALQEAEQEDLLPQTEEPQEPTTSAETETEDNDSSTSPAEEAEENEEDEENESEKNNEETEDTEEAVSLDVDNSSTDVIAEAKQHMGTPYVWGGTSPSGFDCSGFIQFVYEEEGKTLPRTVREIWNYGNLVDDPSIGDLVFFETYQAGPSHMGIYLGNGDFIHAGTSEGVTISNYQNTDYWQERYIGAKSID